MKSSITMVIVAGSLLLTANAAMAVSPANPVPQHARTAYAPALQRVAARRLTPNNQLNVDISQFISGMLGGGPVPYANLVRDVRGMRGTGTAAGSDYSAAFDTPVDTSVPDSGAAAAQAASDAEVQAIQSMNDTNAMTASMAAAEEQNDEANAATLQTEINAGM
jgi:hypothetical protein